MAPKKQPVQKQALQKQPKPRSGKSKKEEAPQPAAPAVASAPEAPVNDGFNAGHFQTIRNMKKEILENPFFEGLGVALPLTLEDAGDAGRQVPSRSGPIASPQIQNHGYLIGRRDGFDASCVRVYVCVRVCVWEVATNPVGAASS